MKLLKEIWFSLTTPLKDQIHCFGCGAPIHTNDRSAHENKGHKVSAHDEEYYRMYEQEMK